MSKRTNTTIIHGRHPVVDAIRAGQPFDKIILQQGVRGDFEKELRQLTKSHGIPLQVVPKERLSRYSRGNHQGVIGFLSLMPYYRLSDVLPGIFEKSETPLIVLLDGVTDVRNFGAIARSAEVFGAHALVLPQKGSAQINEEAMKASAGALSNISICREKSLVSAIGFLQMSGIQVFASDLKAEKQIFELDWTQPAAVVVGSEGEGVSASVLKQVNQNFIIPQRGQTDSLNVSVAAGVILYEIVRQRMKG